MSVILVFLTTQLHGLSDDIVSLVPFSGPVLIGEVIDGHSGVCFAIGVFVDGHFREGSLTYVVGFSR